MRLRRNHRRSQHKRNQGPAFDSDYDSEAVKEAIPVKRMSRIRRLLRDPNFNTQMMTIILTMTSDNVHMERRIDSMTSAIDKVRGVSELINNTMRSLKSAAETPGQIKRLLK